MVTASLLSPDETVAKRKKKIFDYLGYAPWPEQAAFHYDNHKVRLVAGGERGGKSISAAMDIIGNFFGELIWIVAADYERTRAEFDYIGDYMEQLGIAKDISKVVNPGKIIYEGKLDEFNLRGRIVTKSAKDPRTLGMEAPDRVIVAEASQVDYETIQRCIGRVAQKDGDVILEGTFETSLGWYAELFNYGQTENEMNLKSFSIPSWANLTDYPGGRNDPKIKYLENNMPKERFQERHGAVPCPPAGMVFPEFKVTIHVNDEIAKLDPNENVYLCIDPGYRGAYAVEVMQVRNGNTPVIVDEIYQQGITTEQAIQIAKVQPWWKQLGGITIDIEAPEAIDTWQAQSPVAVLYQKVPVIAGIDRFRDFLRINPITGKPTFYVNSKCRGFISENGGCVNPFSNQPQVYHYNVHRDGQIMDEKPLSANNHATSGIIYRIVQQFGYSSEGIASSSKVYKVKR